MSEAVDLYSELEDLRDRVDELEATVEALQGDDRESGGDGFGDWRDQAVLDQLESGQRVTVSALRTLYQAHGEVRNKQTIKGRIKSVTTAGPFEYLSPGNWRYTGGEDSE